MNILINIFPMVLETLKTIAIVSFTIFVGYTIFSIYKYYIDIKRKKEIFDMNMRERMVELRALETKIKESEEKIKSSDNKIRRIDNSLKLADFIKEIASQLVVLHYKNYIDNHDIHKITEENIKKLINTIATHIRTSIHYEELDFEVLTLSKEFYDSYIVNITVILITELLKKDVDACDE